jgi:hypothetical protein
MIVQYAVHVAFEMLLPEDQRCLVACGGVRLCKTVQATGSPLPAPNPPTKGVPLI